MGLCEAFARQLGRDEPPKLTRLEVARMLIRARWSACPKCGGELRPFWRDLRVAQCRRCSFRARTTAGTDLAHLRLNLVKFARAVWEVFWGAGCDAKQWGGRNGYKHVSAWRALTKARKRLPRPELAEVDCSTQILGFRSYRNLAYAQVDTKQVFCVGVMHRDPFGHRGLRLLYLWLCRCLRGIRKHNLHHYCAQFTRILQHDR